MHQPNLLCEQTRKQAVREEVARETSNPTNCPFLTARLAFENNEVVANATIFSGGMTNAMRALRVPTLRPEFAWAIAFTKYWTEYKPTQSTFSLESNDAFQARLKSAIDVSPFFKWRFENEQLAREKQISFTTWFLRQPAAFIRQDHHLLIVLEVLRSATIQQLEELAIEYPNLFLADALALCPAFATLALTHQNFDVIDQRGVVDIAFRSVGFATQLQFFNDNLREKPAKILSPFFTNHQAFAIEYFKSQLANDLSSALLQNYLNTKLLAFLEDDLKLVSTVRSVEVAKRKLALSRIAKHTQHLRTAFIDCTADALAANIRIFAVIVTAELLLGLIRRDVDSLTECLMQNYALYEQFVFGADAIVAQLDFSRPHLAARFVQHIPVKKGLVLSDAQLAALAKRTDTPTLSWLVQYFPMNPQTLTRLILQERSLLEYVLANPSDEIVSTLINDFPYTETRPVTLLTSAMDKLRKCYPLTKEQLTKMLVLCDDVLTDWLFKNENDFPTMREIRSDAALCAALRANNPRFLAHTISDQNTTYETFFDLVLANPAFVNRMNQNTPVALQCYLLVAKKHLEQHINADAIHTTLRTASIAATALADARSASSTKIDAGTEVKSKIAALRKLRKDFDTLVDETNHVKDTDKLARLYLLYTHESVADKDLNKRPAKIALAELLINACFDSTAKQYELLIMVLSERDKVTKITRQVFSSNIETPIDYLPTVKQCFLARLEKLEITQLLDLLSHHLLCNTVFKFYPEEIKTLLYKRAEQDNTFTLLALCAPEHRALFDRGVNTLTETRPLLTPQEQQILLTNICNRTSDACSILATNLTLLSWCYNKHPERIKNIIAVGLDANAITLDIVLRSPELTQIFSADELFNRMTPAQAKASLHYRHVLELFNDEPKLRKLLTKAQLSAHDLLKQLFKLETGSYPYLHARALLRIINGESDVILPKPPAPISTLASSTTLQRDASVSAFKPYASVATPEKASAKPLATDAAAISISSPLSSSSTLSRASGSDIAKPSAPLSRADSSTVARSNVAEFVVSSPLSSSASQPRSGSDIAQQPPAPLARTESLSNAAVASPKSPSGSVILDSAPATPPRASAPSSSESPPAAPSGNTTPITSVVLPTSPAREVQPSEDPSQSAVAASPPLVIAQPIAAPEASATATETSNTNKDSAEKPTPPSTSISSASQALLVIDTTAQSAAAAAASSPAKKTDTENKEPPSAPTELSATALKAPPAPPTMKAPPPPPAKQAAAQIPPELAAEQPDRDSLLSAIQGAGGKVQKGSSGFKLKKPAGKPAARSVSDIAQQPPVPLVRTESLGNAPAASPKSPSGSVITEAATSTPVHTSVVSSSDSPPPPPSGNATPMTSVVLPTSPAREVQPSEVRLQPAAVDAATSTLTVAQPIASTSINTSSTPTHETGEKPTPPLASGSSPRKDVLVQDSVAANSAAAAAASPTKAQTDTENKETPVSVPPAPTPTAIKPPPPPPLKKPAATSSLPEGATVSQPGRNNLLADIANLGFAKRVKSAAKPAAKGPGLFDNSAAVAAASSNNSAPATQEINAQLLTFIETKIGNEKKKEIETHVAPLINAIRTADPSTYEKLIEQLTEKLIALTKSGLESTLALALSNRRTAIRPASIYGDDESPVNTNQGDWDEGASSNAAPPTRPSGSSIAKSPVDSKTAPIIAEIRRVYPCPTPSPTPSV